MKRNYNTGIKNDVIFFIGKEVEKTPAYNKKTLFVVGLQPVDEIINLYRNYNCEHIYLGANQSFYLDTNIAINSITCDISVNKIDETTWTSLINKLLDIDILVTLDFDLKFLEWVSSQTFCNHINFIPQLSIKIPNIRNLNYNTTLKIDDVDFKLTNPGIWCHNLNDLQTINTFTPWSEYTKDEIL